MPDTQQRIQSIIDENQIVLFMKGNAQQPRCGFSARAVGILQELGVAFETVDVLGDPEIRSGIKTFSDWPTIPQLYINKEFVGGSDIVMEMSQSGELNQLLGVEYVEPIKPSITITDDMVAALQHFGASHSGLARLEVSANFQYNITFSEQKTGDFVVESNGVTMLVDKSSARRADGIKLDYKPGTGGGVIIDNPNEPPTVTQIDVFQLRNLMESGAITVFDVRSTREREIAAIKDSIHLNEEGESTLKKLVKDTPIAFYCHHGVRSQQAAEHYRTMGFSNVHNVVGGIDAWSLNIDTDVTRY